MSGKVYLVGAGPGDPGLITVRGAELLAKADVVVYDHLASPRLPARTPRGCKLVYAGKQSGAAELTQEQINALLVVEARAGKTVVRLKGGDPLIFGRGGEEALALAEAGVEFEIVPGVTAASAAAACAGIAVTHRGMSSCLGLVTGHEDPTKQSGELDWRALAAWPGTLVFYMGVANLESICRRLVEGGMDSATPAAAVRWAGTPQQQVVTGTVADLPGRAGQANLRPPAVVIVGRVVALREKITWFERRPLFGQRIVVTRPAGQAEQLVRRLEELGAQAIECPIIAIEPLADRAALLAAARNLRQFNWIVFASANAVEALVSAVSQTGGDGRALAGCKLCCIGEATAARLAGFGLRADLVPPHSTTEGIVEALAAGELRGAKVLCPRSDIAPPALPDALAANGAEVTALIVYRTRPSDAAAEQLRRLLAEGQADWITLTSASAVAGLLAAVAADAIGGAKVRLASIGPATSAAIREAGFEVSVEATEHTVEGLAAAIVGTVQQRGPGR